MQAVRRHSRRTSGSASAARPAREHKSELGGVRGSCAALAAKNLSAAETPFFAGAGAYRHHVPATVDHIIQRSEFLTSYTPYQPEITQGTLQSLFEFQTQVANLTAMDVANASMYDGSTGNRRGRADGPPPDKAQQGRAVRRSASPLPGRDGEPFRHGRRQAGRAAARSGRYAKTSSPASTMKPRASSFSRRQSTAS